MSEVTGPVDERGTYATGTVKFWKGEKGWGAVVSDQVPADVFIHFAKIDLPGYRELFAGQRVEFRWVGARQDSFSCVATWLRPLTPQATPE